MTKIGGKCQSKNSKWDILNDFQTMCFCVTVQNEWNMWFRIFIKKITPLSHFSHYSWQVCGHFDPYYIHRVASHRQVTKKGRRRTISTATFLIFWDSFTLLPTLEGIASCLFVVVRVMPLPGRPFWKAKPKNCSTFLVSFRARIDLTTCPLLTLIQLHQLFVKYDTFKKP